jgi:hypothetical protein
MEKMNLGLGGLLFALALGFLTTIFSPTNQVGPLVLVSASVALLLNYSMQFMLKEMKKELNTLNPTSSKDKENP